MNTQNNIERLKVKKLRALKLVLLVIKKILSFYFRLYWAVNLYYHFI